MVDLTQTPLDLQTLSAPPPTLSQNLSTQLPNVTVQPTNPTGGGLGGILHGLFSANPQNDYMHQAQQGPGGLAGLLPQGSGAQTLLNKLGDSLLIANGLPPMHRQFIQQRAEAEAEAPMFKTGPFNPDGSLSDGAKQSIAGLAQVNPQAALELQGNLVKSQIATAQMRREQAVSQADIDAKNTETTNKRVQAGLSLLSAANEQNYPVVAKQVQAYWDRNGVPQEVRPQLPGAYDKNALDQIRMAGVPVTRQIALDQGQQRINETGSYHKAMIPIQQEKADAAMKGAGAQGGRAGAAITDAGVNGQRLEETIRHNKEMEEIARTKGHGHSLVPRAAAGAPSGGVALPPVAPAGTVKYGSNGMKIVSDGKQWYVGH